MTAIKKLRKKLRMTQEHFAYALQTSLRTVERLEAGSAPCELLLLMKWIADELGYESLVCEFNQKVQDLSEAKGKAFFERILKWHNDPRDNPKSTR